MSRLFRFNPEHEIALAADRANFTPPRQAAMLRKSAAAIMGWLGREGDYVVVEVADEAERREVQRWLARVAELDFRATPLYIGESELRKNSRCSLPTYITELQPWGWDRAAAAAFRRLGADSSLLPDELMLSEIRRTAHRRVSAKLTEAVIEATPDHLRQYLTPWIPEEVNNPETIAELLSSKGRIFTKLPYSSSGRGVTDSASLPPATFLRQIAGQIKQQGSVMVEHPYEPVVDFAMLFAVENSRAELRDYSLFFNHRGTGYGGNIILPSSEIERHLTEFIPVDLLHTTAAAISNTLSILLPVGYKGMAGVDMMIAKLDGAYILVPCVELNLRYTMGMVAAALSRRPQLCGMMMAVTPPGIHPAQGSIPLVPQNQLFNITCTPATDWSDGRNI